MGLVVRAPERARLRQARGHGHARGCFRGRRSCSTPRGGSIAGSRQADTGDRTVYLAEVLDARPTGSRRFLTVQQLRARVPDDKRRALEEQMARDIAIDRRPSRTGDVGSDVVDGVRPFLTDHEQGRHERTRGGSEDRDVLLARLRHRAGRFRALAEARGMTLESHPIEAKGPGGGALAIDVARAGAERPDGVVVVSSGLHGVEGYFGAAVQLALLDRPDSCRAARGASHSCCCTCSTRSASPGSAASTRTTST